MYVLVFVDEINYSCGPTSIDWSSEVCKVSNTVAKLKKYVSKFNNNSGSIVMWNKNGKFNNNSGSIVKWNKNESGQWIGQVHYQDEEESEEPDQYYIIMKVGQIK
jgi:hypothetical protein